MLLHGLSTYTRHQSVLKEEKCLISTKLWSFASTFEKEQGCLSIRSAGGVLEGLSGDAGDALFSPFFLFLHSCWEAFAFSLLQDTVTPNLRLSQNTDFQLFAPQVNLSLQHQGWCSALLEKRRLGME